MSQPPTLDAKGLAALLCKSEATILRNVTRSPENLPPFVKVGKNTIWITEVVWNWLAGKSSKPITIKIEIGSSITSVSQKNRPPPMPPLAEMIMAATTRR